MPNYGVSGQLGWGEESTWGIAVAIAKFSEFISENLKLTRAPLVSPGIRGTRSRQIEQFAYGRRAVEGEIAFDFWAKGLGLWIKHAMGSVASAQQGGTPAYLHTFSLANALPAGLTVEVGRVQQYHKYVGCRVNQLTFRAALDEYVRMTAGILGKDETSIAGTGASASYLSGNELLNFTQAVFKVGGVAIDCKEMVVTLDNMLGADAYKLSSDARTGLNPKGRKVSGTFVLPYDNADAITEYTKFRNGTTAALDLVCTGSVISGAYNFLLTISLPFVKYVSAEPALGGIEEEVRSPIAFEAFKSGATDEIAVTVQNTETAI